MAWIRIEDSIFRNRKIVELPPNSKLLLIGSLCHCADQMTDGFIATGAAKATAGLLGVPWTAHKPLVDGGLWHKAEGGFMVHDYLDYQPSSQQERQRREAEADRKRRWREANARRSGEAADQRNNGTVPPSVPPHVPPGQTPGQTPSVPPSVTAEKTGDPDSQVVKASLPANDGRGEHLRDRKPDNPKIQKLVDRYLSICDQRPGAQQRLRAETEWWMPHLLDHVDFDVIDECIGRCEAQSATPPRTVGYLVQTVRTHVAPHQIVIPDPPAQEAS